MKISSNFFPESKISFKKLEFAEYFIESLLTNLFILTDTKDAWKDILDLNDEFPATEIREDDYTQFLAGMMCKHFVITESSYHWWIAYMGIIKSPEKKVLYFDTNDYNERNLILPEWIKVDW